MSEENRLLAYNIRTKERKVPMYNVVINKITTGNRVTGLAKGTTEDGKAKLALVISVAKAEEAINAGVAARGEGWD